MVVHKGSLELLDKICQGGELQHYPAKQHIPLYGDEVLILYRGFVQLQTFDHSGDESVLGVLGPMMTISRSFSNLALYEIYTLSEVDLVRLSWQDIDKSQSLTLEMNQLLTRGLRQVQILLTLINKNRVDERLLGLLAFLAREFGKETPEGIHIDIPLTHQQIANIVGTKRVTVSRCLVVFKKVSLLSKKKGRQLYVYQEVLNMA